MTSVAVVILNYNGEDLLQRFLPSVVQNSGDAQVIVVDNGSTDSSIKVINQFPKVELIQLQENLGFCKGYNKAINQIEKEIVILLNSDVEVTPGWLTSPVERLKSDPNIVAVQPKILSFSNKHQFEYAGAGGGFIDALGYPLCRGRVFQTLENDDGQYDDSRRVFWASGACLIIKRARFLEAGGFDEDFFAHMEEIDLCWRLNRAGYSIFYDSNSTVYHLGGGTLSVDSPRKVYYNFRNGLSILLKNWPLFNLMIFLPFRIFLDYSAAFLFALKGSPQSGWAVIKAHLHSIKGIIKNLRKRRSNGNLSYHLPEHLSINKMIVFQYFLFGRRKFKEISNPK